MPDTPPTSAAPWGVCAACNSGACATADRLGRKATCDCCATHGATSARRNGPPWPGQRPDVHDHKPQDECPPDCPTRHPEWFKEADDG